MPSTPIVLLTDRAWPDCDIERDVLARIGAEIVEAPAADEATLLALVPRADAIGTCWAAVTPAIIEAAPRCRIVARFGIGLDNISIATATARGIPVTNVPDYCISEVADHTLALVLACARKVAFFNSRTKQGVYERNSGPPLRRLKGRVLGLVGLGRIGRDVHRKAKAFGFEVIAHTASGRDHGTGCTMTSFDEVLERSDFISLHLPLSERSQGMFGAAQFSRMKRSAWLINTSRGGLVDTGALWEAIDSGRIAGTALDVFDPEPPDLSHPLYRDERVIVTPHVAFMSQESLADLRTRAAGQIAAALAGRRPDDVVNPEIYERPAQSDR